MRIAPDPGGLATLSLCWTQADDISREFKRMLYIAWFLLFFPIMANKRPDRVVRLLQWAGIGIGVAAAASMVKFFGIEHHLWHDRLEGIGELSHPILGAYVVGVAAVWLLLLPPRNRWLQVAWVLALALAGAFVVMSQSRGAVLALFFTVVALPVWCRHRRSFIWPVQPCWLRPSGSGCLSR